MKDKIKRPHPHVNRKNGKKGINEDLFEFCLRKGLIEKTPYGYYFTPEFFETLEIYDE